MPALLKRLPAWATTGVGSLPFDDPGIAVTHACEAYEVPFCPQLPRLDGDMVVEWLGADPRRCGWSSARDRERPRAWDLFLASVGARPPAHRVVKLQVTGPVTLAIALERAAESAPSRRAAAELAGELSGWLAANVAGQALALNERGLDTILVIDEPAVRALGTPGLDRVWDPLRGVAPAWGLHFCCRVPWELVERAEPDLLSFDLSLEPLLRRDAVSALRRLARRGGRVAWGLVAPHGAADTAAGHRLLGDALEQTDLAGESSLVTPSCGSGRVSISRERRLSSAVDEIARRMRPEILTVAP